MTSTMTFGKKLAFGFAMVVGITLIVSAAGIYAVQAVVRQKDHVINVDTKDLVDTEELEALSWAREASNRGYFLTKDDLFVKEIADRREQFESVVKRMRERSNDNDMDKSESLKRVEAASDAQAAAADEVVKMRSSGALLDEVAKAFPVKIVPRANELRQVLEDFKKAERLSMDAATAAASDFASHAIYLVIAIAAAAVLIAATVAILLIRTLSRQIGTAVQHIQSSSAELQSAANQQTAGSKEQVASMSEISTTIKELLLTAKQIAQSAQRVAHIAQDTGEAAAEGDVAVRKTQDDVGGIRRQVDLIVTHMLDLGKKSQQIGGILEIINELAEQTNILAINATIEAAGAGESGKRFAVVADEVRKLADRVGGSTREIRGLIDEIRSAVNTTVMATESGSKAVDVGIQQCAQVAGVFKKIAGMLGTTTEAAREIELSTKQQSTAVEQVNIAVANVAQAAKEAEASSGQVLQTVSELTSLSRDLTRLVQPNKNAA